MRAAILMLLVAAVGCDQSSPAIDPIIIGGDATRPDRALPDGRPPAVTVDRGPFDANPLDAGTPDAVPRDTASAPIGRYDEPITSPVVIEELIRHRSANDPTGWIEDPTSWIELANVSDAPVDLTGWWLSDDGARYQSSDFLTGAMLFDGPVLAPGERLVLRGNHRLMHAPAHHYHFDLHERGTVMLVRPDGTLADRLRWTPFDVGVGSAFGRCGDEPTRTGPLEAPTEGAPNSPCAVDSVRLSEVRHGAWAVGGLGASWVELANVGPEAVDVEGWTVRFGRGGTPSSPTRSSPVLARPYTVSPPLAAGSVIRPGERVIFPALAALPPFDAPEPRHRNDERRFGAALHDETDRVIDLFEWRGRDAAPGSSLGRCDEGEGAVVEPLAMTTPGAANAPCSRLPPAGVIIDEIAQRWDPDTGREVSEIELENTADAPFAGVELSLVWQPDEGEAEVHPVPPLEAGERAVIGLAASAPVATVALVEAGGHVRDATRFEAARAAPASSWGRCGDAPARFDVLETPTLGQPNEDCAPSTVVINEATHGRADDDWDDWVELYNRGPAAVDLSGWTLSDRLPVGNQPFRFPEGETLDAGAFLVLDRQRLGFGLRDDDGLDLRDGRGTLVDSLSFHVPKGPSQGRWPDGEGESGALWVRTPGEPNPRPLAYAEDDIMTFAPMIDGPWVFRLPEVGVVPPSGPGACYTPSGVGTEHHLIRFVAPTGGVWRFSFDEWQSADDGWPRWVPEMLDYNYTVVGRREDGPLSLGACLRTSPRSSPWGSALRRGETVLLYAASPPGPATLRATRESAPGGSGDPCVGQSDCRGDSRCLSSRVPREHVCVPGRSGDVGEACMDWTPSGCGGWLSCIGSCSWEACAPTRGVCDIPSVSRAGESCAGPVCGAGLECERIDTAALCVERPPCGGGAACHRGVPCVDGVCEACRPRAGSAPLREEGGEWIGRGLGDATMAPDEEWTFTAPRAGLYRVQATPRQSAVAQHWTLEWGCPGRSTLDVRGQVFDGVARRSLWFDEGQPVNIQVRARGHYTLSVTPYPPP